MATETTLLVIDDDPAIARVLEFAVEILDGWSARFATDEPTARSALRAGTPDFILLDLNLARSSGLDVLAALRRDYDLGGTRVVLMTAAGAVHTTEQLAAWGISDALTKPFDPLSLPTLLRR